MLFLLQKIVQVLGDFGNSSGSKDDPFEKTVFVLTSNAFQKWYLSQGDPERLVYSCDIESLAKRAFAANTWVSQFFFFQKILNQIWDSSATKAHETSYT